MCRERELDDLITNLFNLYSVPICAYIYALVKDWQLAQELTQETYLRLCRTRERLPEIDNQRAWIYRIARNLTLNEIKRRRRFAWLPWRSTDETIQFSWIEITHQVDSRADIEETLRLLPEHYRSPLILYSSHGLSVKEIAEALELSESAARRRQPQRQRQP